MLKNIFCILLLVIFFLALLTGLTQKNRENNHDNMDKYQDSDEGNNEKKSSKAGNKKEGVSGAGTNDTEVITEEEGAADAGEAAAEPSIEETYYQKDGIEAYYPKIISGGSETEMGSWNNLIDKDFQKILEIYSFNPFPEPTPGPSEAVPTILKIEDEVRLNSERFFSVFYKAAYNSPYSAHPTELIYTTNIDKSKKKRLRLPEILNINKKFIDDFRTWKFIPVDQDNEELNAAIRDYLSGISDEDLLMGFQKADQIGSNNIWGIYSYLTPNRLGISLSVPNYLGDHVEFEQEYTKVLKYLNLNYR